MMPVTPAPVSLFGATLDPLGATTSTSAVGHMQSVAHGLDIVPAAGNAVAAPAPFASLVTEAVGQVQQLEQQSKVAIEGLMTGNGVDVHEATIAAQKAGMGFELMLSVRNKALAAYQQVMGMQF